MENEDLEILEDAKSETEELETEVAPKNWTGC
jgi:hypothetical protein